MPRSASEVIVQAPFLDDLPAYTRYTDAILARHPERRYTIIRPVASDRGPTRRSAGE